jgi:predicted permease
MRDLLKNTPGWVIVVCATLVILTFGAFTFWMSYKGIDDTQFRGFVILISTLVNTLLSGGALLASSAAQKQTNGNFTEAVKSAVRDVHKEQDNGSA